MPGQRDGGGRERGIAEGERDKESERERREGEEREREYKRRILHSAANKRSHTSLVSSPSVLHRLSELIHI